MSLPFVFCCFSLVRFKEKKTLDFVQNFGQIEIKKTQINNVNKIITKILVSIISYVLKKHSYHMHSLTDIKYAF